MVAARPGSADADFPGDEAKVPGMFLIKF